MHVMPRTLLGRWSVWLAAAFILLFFGFHLVRFDAGSGEPFAANRLFTVSIVASAFCAVSAFVTGLIAVFHREEKAVLVFVSMAVGLAVTLFVAGEFVFSH